MKTSDRIHAEIQLIAALVIMYATIIHAYEHDWYGALFAGTLALACAGWFGYIVGHDGL